MKKEKIVLLLALLLSLFMGVMESGVQAEDPLKVVLILPGRADDVSWNQAMYEGMQKVEAAYEGQIVVTYVEEIYTPAETEKAIWDFASEGYDVIFGHGIQFMEPIINAAKHFPDTYFVLGNGYRMEKNTCIYDMRLEQGGYLMGLLAGLLTETNSIGVVGGEDVSLIFRGHEAFKYGARQVNPQVRIEELYTDDWRDSATAREGAMSMYESGVDIIWHSGNGLGLGVVEAAREMDAMVMGTAMDQYSIAPEHTISSVVYEYSKPIQWILEDIITGTFHELGEAERFYWMTVANEAITIAPFHHHEEWIPQDVIDKVMEAQKAFIDGTLELPEFQ